MDSSLMISGAIFVAISGGVWAVLTMFAPKEDRASERLQELRDPGRRAQQDKGGVTNVIQAAAPALSKALQPKSELEQNELKVRLANAGFNSPNAATLFLALKTTSLMVGLVLGGGWGVIQNGLDLNAASALFMGGGLGFYLPEIVVRIMKMGRQGRIFLSMPDALDLLVVCVEAGLGLDAAMRRVCEELGDSAPDICGELAMCNMQLQMGRPRREVLHDLGVRTGVDDVKALATILIQADRFGSSIAQALRVQSDSMRTKRSQLAEEKAAQTAVKMIFPLVLFIFPGIFVVLVGPAAILMIRNLLTT
ncbi:MAG: type II secretion system F family protein [Planctomyces sp.]|nr:type II secretion system F family protein [Planctomyces sp.]